MMNKAADWQGFTSYTGAIYKVSQPPQGMNSHVFHLHTQNGEFIVKTGEKPGTIAEIQREADVLRFLAGQVPESRGGVPRFVAREGAYFLFTYLPGENLAFYSANLAKDGTVCADLVYQLGQLLGIIHTWTPPWASIPPNQTRTALQICISHLESGTRGDALDYPFSRFHGAKIADLLRLARDAAPTVTDEITWCHGDFCVPNAIVWQGRVAYAIDWGAGRYADRRFDLATALWSLRRNDLGAFLSDFLRGYNGNATVENLALFELIYAVLP